MTPELWQECLARLEDRLTHKAYGTYILPLLASGDTDEMLLLAPNDLVQEEIETRYQGEINKVLSELLGESDVSVRISVGGHRTGNKSADKPAAQHKTAADPDALGRLDPRYTFASFVAGKSNSIARAAAEQVGDHPGGPYNPLLIYGGSGLGKTHLMHAIGHRLRERNPKARAVYLSAESFVNRMVAAIRYNKTEEFKRHFRSADALLIDDIHFFAGKRQSQEEFFHTFNALLEAKQQIVMTCDRYPKELDDLDERLKSRFTWGLSVSVEPPELETRVAILISKAIAQRVTLPEDVAFLVAKRVKSNIRDLEGALARLVAHAGFTGQAITVEFARQTLHDVLASHDRQVSIENIQKVVSEYYKIRVNDLLSARRSRSLARPRQVAMTLAKELTNHSYPAIGEAFGGRDHTTVLHAYRKIQELRQSDTQINEDYNNLHRTLSR